MFQLIGAFREHAVIENDGQFRFGSQQAHVDVVDGADDDVSGQAVLVQIGEIVGGNFLIEIDIIGAALFTLADFILAARIIQCSLLRRPFVKDISCPQQVVVGPFIGLLVTHENDVSVVRRRRVRLDGFENDIVFRIQFVEHAGDAGENVQSQDASRFQGLIFFFQGRRPSRPAVFAEQQQRHPIGESVVVQLQQRLVVRRRSRRCCKGASQQANEVNHRSIPPYDLCETIRICSSRQVRTRRDRPPAAVS